MKKSLFTAVAMLIAAMPLFTSCDKDEPTTTPDPTDLAKEIAGTYVGSLSVLIGEPDPANPVTPIDATILLTESGDKIKMTLEGDLFKGIIEGTIELDGITVTKEKDNYALNGAGNIKVKLFNQDTELPITVSGNGVRTSMQLNIGVTVSELGIINVDFSGAVK